MKAGAYVLAVLTLMLASACGGGDGGGGELGEPCAEHEDCADDLICDVHNDRGSCQKPHDH